MRHVLLPPIVACFAGGNGRATGERHAGQKAALQAEVASLRPQCDEPCYMYYSFFAIRSVNEGLEIRRCLHSLLSLRSRRVRRFRGCGVLAFRFGRAAWVDEQSSDPLDYCSTNCAARVQMHHLVGRGECSLPGCIHKCLIHQHTLEETGYCSEDHRVRATARMLVSGGQAGQGGKDLQVFPPLLYSSSTLGNDVISRGVGVLLYFF